MKKQKHGDQKVEIFSASETGPEKKSGVPILLLIVFLILVAGAAAGFSYIRTLHTAQCDGKYRKDASETVGKLEEFHARTGTGGNLTGYSEEVGRLNAVIKTFKEKYQAQPEAVYVSYWAIISAGDCYNSAKEEWNHSKQPEFESNPRKEKISRSWSIASDYIKLAKASIPEEGREKPKNSERKKELSALADKQMDMVSQDLASLKSGDSSGASPTPSPLAISGLPAADALKTTGDAKTGNYRDTKAVWNSDSHSYSSFCRKSAICLTGHFYERRGEDGNSAGKNSGEFRNARSQNRRAPAGQLDRLFHR